MTNWWNAHSWLYVTRSDLEVERSQCLDEGKKLVRLEAEFAALLAPDLPADTMAFQIRAGKLLDQTARLRPKTGSAHHEPSDLAGIRRARAPHPAPPPPPPRDPAALRDKALGAWVGRAAGCLLGKPVEGRRRAQIAQYLQSQSRWPLTAYFSSHADEAVRRECKFPSPDNPCYLENITCMVEDDDTNYTTVGLALIEKRGRNFTPADMATFWLENIPILHTCTAERVAYRNLVDLVPPPDADGSVSGRFSSATYRNPYREWIGAQIRADFFGYVSPGLPEQAAEYAWRDACISHVKNGIYGEMWVAAMLAAAYGISDDPAAVIRAGLAQIPRRCRLQADLGEILAWHASGIGYEAAIDRLHARWNEADRHHWCHTNSNAQIVAIALLWGNLDFTRTIGYAVMPGFDTDCNGATAGSVLGLMLGGRRIPAQWADPLNDTLLTGVAGYHKVSLTHLADKTVELIGKG